MPRRIADTTAIFEYHVGAKTPRSEVRTLLAERRNVRTSEHAVREWRRILVHTVNDLLAALDTEPDLPAVFSRLSQGHGREPSQRLRALALCAGADVLDPVEARVRCLQLLRVDIDRLIDDLVCEVRHPSECALATEVPKLGAKGDWTIRWTCKRGEGICVRDDRLETDIARWRAGGQALRDHDDHSYRRQGKAAATMAEDRAMRTGKLCYASTGDMGIALDGEPGEEIVTTDRSFTVLGPPMGLTVHLVSTKRSP